MVNHIRRRAKEVLREAKGRGGHDKETWWWNVDMQQAITEKKRCFKDWQRARCLKSFELYKQAKRLSNKAVGEAKKRAREHRVFLFHRKVSAKEVGEALKRMKSGKAVGPNDIPIEAWKCLREVEIQWLTRLFNRILESRKMPNLWRHSIVVPIYKNKGNIQNCSNYRGIKLMSHTMKLWERAIKQRLRSLTTVSDNQFGFVIGLMPNCFGPQDLLCLGLPVPFLT
ncbi:hypothetical protein UlMin_011826 [Ulmus minor]